MKISSVVCTHNRAAYLEPAIRSLLRQTLPQKDYEIIVVDNASSDNTRLIVEEIMRESTNLRYLYEPKLGNSIGRNRGILESSGDIVAFMDDDATADPGWLQSLCDAFRQVEPRPACVGGRLLPEWEAPPPPWLPECLVAHFGVLDYGGTSRVLDIPREYLILCNMAIDRQYVLEEIGGFDPYLGRKGADLGGNEEIALLQEIQNRGGTVYYEANAVVHHVIQAERLTRRWLFRRFFDGERSVVRTRQRFGEERMIRDFVRHFGRALKAAVLVSLSSLSGNGKKQTLHLVFLASELGALTQILRGAPRKETQRET